jgi:nicotinamide-nucleotide adenylyltransferase
LYDQRPAHGIGAIHGRFQPFHRGHMRYLLLALARARVVYIGITNPDAPGAGHFEGTDPVRHQASHNPLSFEQRELLIQAALAHHHDEIPSSRVRVVPFDVSAEPSRWSATIPREAVQFVAAHEPWDHEKARRFASAGYSVEFLLTEEHRTTATEVRNLVRARSRQWRTLLPPGVADAMETAELVPLIQGRTAHPNLDKKASHD